VILGRTEKFSIHQEALIRLSIGKGIFTKVEFLQMVKVLDREMKRKEVCGSQARIKSLKRFTRRYREPHGVVEKMDERRKIMETLKRMDANSLAIICSFCLLAFAMLGLLASANGAEEERPLPNRQDGIFIARNFQFQSGDTLSELKLAYTTLGTPQRDSSGSITNAVLLLHGTTGTAAN
jgi:hypothetical protein